ncbi:uncharacterized protein LOC143461985 isoform X3 [Clavelina lepadiformis]|uniref:uncharacterized protein LOC143461985 isoform X3 n=1 Tax=Clavelina lepadiformis TaxID=159417 RepID=UPI004042C81C
MGITKSIPQNISLNDVKVYLVCGLVPKRKQYSISKEQAQKFRKFASNFEFDENGQLQFVKRASGFDSVTLPVLESDDQALPIFQNEHVCGSKHLSFKDTFHKIFQNYFWLTMLEDIRSWVDKCKECKAEKQKWKEISTVILKEHCYASNHYNYPQEFHDDSNLPLGIFGDCFSDLKANKISPTPKQCTKAWKIVNVKGFEDFKWDHDYVPDKLTMKRKYVSLVGSSSGLIKRRRLEWHNNKIKLLAKDAGNFSSAQQRYEEDVQPMTKLPQPTTNIKPVVEKDFKIPSPPYRYDFIPDMEDETFPFLLGLEQAAYFLEFASLGQNALFPSRCFMCKTDFSPTWFNGGNNRKMCFSCLKNQQKSQLLKKHSSLIKSHQGKCNLIPMNHKKALQNQITRLAKPAKVSLKSSSKSIRNANTRLLQVGPNTFTVHGGTHSSKLNDFLLKHQNKQALALRNSHKIRTISQQQNSTQANVNAVAGQAQRKHCAVTGKKPIQLLASVKVNSPKTTGTLRPISKLRLKTLSNTKGDRIKLRPRQVAQSIQTNNNFPEVKKREKVQAYLCWLKQQKTQPPQQQIKKAQTLKTLHHTSKTMPVSTEPFATKQIAHRSKPALSTQARVHDFKSSTMHVKTAISSRNRDGKVTPVGSFVLPRNLKVSSINLSRDGRTHIMTVKRKSTQESEKNNEVKRYTIKNEQIQRNILKWKQQLQRKKLEQIKDLAERQKALLRQRMQLKKT